MGIKGITDKPASLPILGVLRKGAKKEANRPGKDLEYFRIDFAPQYASLSQCWLDLYGPQPKEIGGVMLMAQTPDEAFTAWREEWQASTLKYRCDGENIIEAYNPAAQRTMPTSTPCRENAEDPAKRCKCKNTGRLPFYLPTFIKHSNVLGLFMLTTTSVNDVIALMMYLRAIYGTAGRVNGIPLILGRAPKEISVPKPNSAERIRVTKNMLYLNIEPEYTSHMLQMLADTARGALPAQTGTVSPDGEIALPEGQYEDDGEIPVF